MTVSLIAVGRTAKHRADVESPFRHSAASMVNAETGNLKLAQKLLGHSNLNTTADVYTHTSAEDERQAALALERASYGNLFRTVPETANKNSRAAN